MFARFSRGPHITYPITADAAPGTASFDGHGIVAFVGNVHGPLLIVSRPAVAVRGETERAGSAEQRDSRAGQDLVFGLKKARGTDERDVVHAGLTLLAV